MSYPLVDCGGPSGAKAAHYRRLPRDQRVGQPIWLPVFLRPSPHPWGLFATLEASNNVSRFDDRAVAPMVQEMRETARRLPGRACGGHPGARRFSRLLGGAKPTRLSPSQARATAAAPLTARAGIRTRTGFPRRPGRARVLARASLCKLTCQPNPAGRVSGVRPCGIILRAYNELNELPETVNPALALVCQRS